MPDDGGGRPAPQPSWFLVLTMATPTAHTAPAHTATAPGRVLVTGLGAAFAKNDTRGLDSQLTDTLAQMRADGTLERIVGRYLENASQYLEVDTIGA